MQRRKFIKAVGLGTVAGSAGLAGCAGSLGKPSSVSVRIDYFGDWSGAIGSSGSTSSVSSYGPETYTWDNDIPNVVSANAQKRDGGTGTLTVQIRADGDVVKEASTRSQYGVASVSHSF